MMSKDRRGCVAKRVGSDGRCKLIYPWEPTLVSFILGASFIQARVKSKDG